MLHTAFINAALSVLLTCLVGLQAVHVQPAPPTKPDAKQLELRLNQLADSLNKKIDALKEGNAVRDKQIERYVERIFLLRL